MHGEALVAVRYFSGLYRDLVLETYMYLQEKAQSDFMTPKVQESIYKLHVDLFAQIRGGGGANLSGAGKGAGSRPPGEGAKAGAADNPQCSHCRGRKNVHTGGKSNCPFKDLTLEKARAAAKEVCKAIGVAAKKEKEVDLSALIAKAAAKNK